MAGFDYQVTGFAYQGAGEFVYQGTSGTPPTTTNYGVTAGAGMSCYVGETLANAHGVGGNQRGVGGCEGIPYDAPQ